MTWQNVKHRKYFYFLPGHCKQSHKIGQFSNFWIIICYALLLRSDRCTWTRHTIHALIFHCQQIFIMWAHLYQRKPWWQRWFPHQSLQTISYIWICIVGSMVADIMWLLYNNIMWVNYSSLLLETQKTRIEDDHRC